MLLINCYEWQIWSHGESYLYHVIFFPFSVKRQYYGGYGDAGCGGCCGTNDWCAGGTMCSNCKGGFYPPVTCSGCNTGCCPGITFPCVFGASVNNPGCECCKEKTPPGKCKWPCMWPCCCTCTPPKFEFKPLKPEPVCHCPSPHSHHTACGNHCLKRTGECSWKFTTMKRTDNWCLADVLSSTNPEHRNL